MQIISYDLAAAPAPGRFPPLGISNLFDYFHLVSPERGVAPRRSIQRGREVSCLDHLACRRINAPDRRRRSIQAVTPINPTRRLERITHFFPMIEPTRSGVVFQPLVLVFDRKLVLHLIRLHAGAAAGDSPKPCLVPFLPLHHFSIAASR
jgi:hypothetical protein